MLLTEKLDVQKILTSIWHNHQLITKDAGQSEWMPGVKSGMTVASFSRGQLIRPDCWGFFL